MAPLPATPSRHALVRRASALLGALVLAVSVVSVGSAAQADDSLEDQVSAIVGSVGSGQPLRVVVTRTSAGGRPAFETTVVSTLDAARDLVRSALTKGETVSMAQPAQAMRSNDTGRSRQWALSRLKAESVWSATTGGASRRKGNRQATVAVVDTGVAAHVDLGSNRLAGRDFVDPGTSATDPNGHGTHVAGIVAAIANNRRGVAGLAPHARILPVRVLDADGSGTTDVIARGVVWATDQGAQVINMSLAATQSDTALLKAVQYAQRQGVLVVAAAGNDGQGCFLFGCPTQYPAAYTDVVGVGAVTSSLSRASFSSFGSWVDIAAPGDVILSTIPSSQRLGGDCDGRRYCALSGTSMASPYVAAAAALAYSERGWRGTRIASRLFSTATDLGSSGRDDSYGYGLVNPAALIRAK